MKWFPHLRERWASYRGHPALDSLLAYVKPDMPLPDRVAWLEDLLAWVRRDTPTTRLRLLLRNLERQPEASARVSRTLRSIIRDTQALDLFADTGLPQGSGFIHELISRLGSGLLPNSPDTRDLADVFDRLFPRESDAVWLEQLDGDLCLQVIEFFLRNETPDEVGWASLIADLEDAMVQLADRICVIGSHREIRSRIAKTPFRDLPFQKLPTAVEALLQANGAGTPVKDLTAELNLVRTRAEACDRCVDDAVAYLEKTGVSTALVYDIERLRAQVRRLELLLDAWSAPVKDAQLTISFVADLVRQNHERRSVSAFCRQNLHLLTRRIVERNAETGEHYVARNRAEYTAMLRSAVGGGVITGFTTIAKLILARLALEGFLRGAAFGINYAVSFAAIQLAGFSLATKQPANTAPTLAKRMAELSKPAHLEALIDEVVFLMRSQIAAVFGNLVAVVPATLLLDWASVLCSGHHVANEHKASLILESVSPDSACWLFAAFTGVLLWSSSLIAAWAGNQYALHQLGPIISNHRRLIRWFGPTRTRAAATWLGGNIAGLTGNIALGFLLGIIPEIMIFFGVPLDVRHVTLSTGQVTAAYATLGLQHMHLYATLWTALGILGIGAINIGVSFSLALTVAIRARNVRGPELTLFYEALANRLLRSPLSFLWPTRGSESGETKSH